MFFNAWCEKNLHLVSCLIVYFWFVFTTNVSHIFYTVFFRLDPSWKAINSFANKLFLSQRLEICRYKTTKFQTNYIFLFVNLELLSRFPANLLLESWRNCLELEQL